ncbi:MAG: aspartate--tRNA(Asn) ligase [Candidatus Micrarchaeota archaeon]
MIRTDYIKDAKNKLGEEITLAGWVHDTRDIGKVRFLILRDKTGLIQVFAKKGAMDDALFEKMVHPRETVLVVKGKAVASKIASGGVEFAPSSIEVLSVPEVKIPLDLTGKVPAELDVRLDNRYVDLRAPRTRAIFTIRAKAAQAFRQSLISQGFEEMHPTCLAAAATEGGADVFSVKYFEKEATLVQSPQFYKQFAVVGGMDKVFMTTPVFRAEKHNTLTHLNEVLQMDAEMGFADDNDALDALERTFLDILQVVAIECKGELELLNSPLHVPAKIPRLTYSELVDKLNSADVKMEFGEDFDTAKEAKLSELLGQEAFFITRWPTALRAFYSMPLESDEELCKAYDLEYRGREISSGAQRIHVPAILIDQLKKRGLDPKAFEFYINAFRMGAPPHAGWSIGLERLVMKMCNLHNIREAVMFPRDRTRLTP